MKTNWKAGMITLEKITRHVRWVREQLEAGTLPGELNMYEIECGSVRCIGGWCRWKETQENPTFVAPSLQNIVNHIKTEDLARGDSLHKLFYSWEPSMPSDRQVMDACNSWLAGSNNPWSET